MTFERAQVGKREALSDVIAVVDAKKTPLYASIRKGSDPANSLFEWQADAYSALRAGAIVDGTDVTTFEDQAASRRILQNYTEEFRVCPQVSKRAAISNVAGVGLKREMAKAISRACLKSNVIGRPLPVATTWRRLTTGPLAIRATASEAGSTTARNPCCRWTRSSARLRRALTRLPWPASLRRW
jgi:hypothetical protein